MNNTILIHNRVDYKYKYRKFNAKVSGGTMLTWKK